MPVQARESPPNLNLLAELPRVVVVVSVVPVPAAAQSPVVERLELYVSELSREQWGISGPTVGIVFGGFVVLSTTASLLNWGDLHAAITMRCSMPAFL